MITKSDTAIEFFDLENASQEEQEDFFQDIGELVMQKILHKAWAELSSAKKDELTELLEESEDDPENSDKQDAILIFLDKHIPNVREIVAEELEEIQNTFREYRDELLDSIA